MLSSHTPGPRLERYPLTATPFERWCQTYDRRPDDFSWAIFEAARAAGVLDDDGTLLVNLPATADPVLAAAAVADTAEVIVPLAQQRARRAWRRRVRRAQDSALPGTVAPVADLAASAQEVSEIMPLVAPPASRVRAASPLRRARRRRDRRVA